MKITEITEKEVYEVQSERKSPVYIVRCALLLSEDWNDAHRVWICQCEGFKHRQKCKHLEAVHGHIAKGAESA